jgi:hypothetical protein
MLLVHLVINNIVTEPWSVKIISSRAHKSYNYIPFCSHVKLFKLFMLKNSVLQWIINYQLYMCQGFFFFFWCVRCACRCWGHCCTYHLLRPPQIASKKLILFRTLDWWMQLTGLLLMLFVYSCKKIKEWSIIAEPPLPKWSFLSPDMCSVFFSPIVRQL